MTVNRVYALVVRAFIHFLGKLIAKRYTIIPTYTLYRTLFLHFTTCRLLSGSLKLTRISAHHCLPQLLCYFGLSDPVGGKAYRVRFVILLISAFYSLVRYRINDSHRKAYAVYRVGLVGKLKLYRYICSTGYVRKCYGCTIRRCCSYARPPGYLPAVIRLCRKGYAFASLYIVARADFAAVYCCFKRAVSVGYVEGYGVFWSRSRQCGATARVVRTAGKYKCYCNKCGYDEYRGSGVCQGKCLVLVACFHLENLLICT